MEQVFFTAAIVCFALAIVAAISAVVIFVRGDVMNAIRFLRHKPTKAHGTSARAKSRVRSAGGVGASSANDVAASLAAAAADRVTDDIDKRTADIDGETDVVATGRFGDAPRGRHAAVDDSELATDVLDDDAAEHPTDILVEGDSEQPTGLLGVEDSEQPTGLLVEEGSEQPTGLLTEEDSENPTGLLAEEESEQPTGLLAEDDSEQPTTTLPSGAERDGVVQHEEASFHFKLKRDEVVVHTDEVIE